jgi:hypothetical protein
MSNKYKPKFLPDKFKELMLYAAEKSRGDDYFGAIKLNKILFFSDFLAFGLMGEPITGATYKRLGQGPVPAEFSWMRKEIEKSHDGVFVKKPIFNHIQIRLMPHRPANPHRFSIEERDLIDSVIDYLAPRTASEVSILSHERSFAWQIADEGEEIPYDAVFLSARKATSMDKTRGLRLARKYGWLDSPAK